MQEIIAINVIVKTKDGSISSCDVPFSDDIKQFNADYLNFTQRVHDTGKPFELGKEYAIVGTSALTECEIDGAVNQYSGIYNNPFLVWGKYRRRFSETILPVSFQFHHVQMDGTEAFRFLNALQKEIDLLKLT